MKNSLDAILAAAAAAPSSHNTQPWRYRVGADLIEVWGDKARMLPQSDANNRQFFISLGCAVENIVTAANAEGRDPQLALFPDASQPLFIARITFSPSSRNDENGAAKLVSIRERHANRDPYRAETVPVEFAETVRGLSSEKLKVVIIEDSVIKQAVAKVVGDSVEGAFHDKGFTEELSHWIRPSLKKYRDGMPGYNIGVPWLVSFLIPLAIRYGNVAKQQRRMVEGPLAATPAYIIISTEEDNPLAWVRSGIVLERIWLSATEKNMVMGPLAAAIQIGGFYRELQKVLGMIWRPQVFARLGYPTKVPVPSPRRAVDELLV